MIALETKSNIEPFFTFKCEQDGYSIAIIPHSENDQKRLERLAEEKQMTIEELAQNEVLGQMIFSGPLEEADADAADMAGLADAFRAACEAKADEIRFWEVE
jgi:hypothetical protein